VVEERRPRLAHNQEIGSSSLPHATKTWMVGPYGNDAWCAVVHADTRGQARKMAAKIEWDDFVAMRATRLPSLDGKLITVTSMLEAGFPPEWEGYPLADTLWGYIDFCSCDICKASRELDREVRDRVDRLKRDMERAFSPRLSLDGLDRSG